jgi:hypothetical protein
LQEIHGDDFLSNPSIMKELSESARSGDTSFASDMMSRYNEDKKKKQQDMDDAKIEDFFKVK